jgi:hypothetical protein
MTTVVAQTPNEAISYSLDWSGLLGGGNSLVVSASFTCNLPGPTLSNTAIGATNTSSSIEVSTVPVSTDPETFPTITGQIQASDGQIFESSFKIHGISNNYD